MLQYKATTARHAPPSVRIKREEMSEKEKVVCVTGASGYIASWLVKLLLLRGYTVNATLRHLHDPKKIDHLVALEGAKERLHLFKADLLEEGSFDAAIKDSIGVFHVASPCFLDCDEHQVWYALSKVLAEEAAWKFIKEKDIDLVTICPGWTLGPLLQPIVNERVAAIYNLIGAKTYPDASYSWVHVIDVANAHIQAFKIPSASGRYALVERCVHFSDIIKMLRDSYPTLQLPNRCVEFKAYLPAHEFSKQKTKSLGIDFIPFETGLRETIECFKEKKLITD